MKSLSNRDRFQARIQSRCTIRPHSRSRSLPAALLAIVAATLLSGCATRPTETTIVINPADYDIAFTAARQALRDERFRLERVDAAEGLITSRPLNTGGIATPFDSEQTTLEDEWQDFIGDRRRVAVITFEPLPDRSLANRPQPADRGTSSAPARTQTAAPQTPLRDLRDLQQQRPNQDTDPAILLRVRVVIERMQQPGIQVPPTAVRRTSRFTDIEWARRGAQAPYPVPVGTDDHLAARITRRIQNALADSQSVGNSTATDDTNNPQ